MQSHRYKGHKQTTEPLPSRIQRNGVYNCFRPHAKSIVQCQRAPKELETCQRSVIHKQRVQSQLSSLLRCLISATSSLQKSTNAPTSDIEMNSTVRGAVEEPISSTELHGNDALFFCECIHSFTNTTRTIAKHYLLTYRY